MRYPPGRLLRRPARSSRWVLGVRARTTIAATVAVGIALVLGALFMTFFVHRSLVRSIDSAGALRARDVATLVESDRLPATVPSTGEQASVVQVVGPNGRVLASSDNVAGEPAISSLRPSTSTSVTGTVSGLPIGNESDKFRLTAVRVATAQGDGVVYVATSLTGVNNTMMAISLLLAVGVPCLIVVVAGTTWMSTGRILRPVEAIRGRVAAIEGADLHARVPQPRTRDEIARLAATMNEMLDRLERASVVQRRFVGDASHELRAPLAALRAQAEVALAHPQHADWPAVMEEVSTEVRRLSDLVGDLLLLAHADEHRLAASADAVDLDDVVLGEVTRLRAISPHRVVVGALQPARVRGSELRLGRALRNLGDNATRHARGTITVSLVRERGRAVVTVADDGAGLPGSDRDRVFDRFTRLDAARDRDAGGTGLGLAIVREIVRAHGGEVFAAEPPTGRSGAVFVIRLPLARDELSGSLSVPLRAPSDADNVHDTSARRV
jgi:signal transduction histidine kinase